MICNFTLSKRPATRQRLSDFCSIVNYTFHTYPKLYVSQIVKAVYIQFITNFFRLPQEIQSKNRYEHSHQIVKNVSHTGHH